MNGERSPDGSKLKTDLRELNGKVVLVRSKQDHRNPPTAMRGSIEVKDRTDAPLQVSLAVEFPQMFETRAHRRTFTLDQEGIARLLASESNGTFEFTIDDELR